MAYSSEIAAGDTALAAQYNNLRKDALYPKVTAGMLSGLKLYLPLDNNALDYSASRKHGAPAGGAIVKQGYEESRIGSGAFYFDGTDDYINIDDVLDVIGADTAGTLSMWVKMPDASVAANNSVLEFADKSATEFLWVVITSSGTVSVTCYDAGAAQWALATDVRALFDNTWTHIAIVQDGTSPVLYIDGVAVAQTFSTSTDKTDWLATLTGIDVANIGTTDHGGEGYANLFPGYIDEVCYWNRALTAAEVLNLFYTGEEFNGLLANDALIKETPALDGLKLYLPLDISTRDYSRYQNDGINTGADLNVDFGDVKVGRGAYYFGGADYLNIDDVLDEISSDTAGTISCWIKMPDSTPGASSVVFSFSDTNANEGLSVVILTDGTISIGSADAGTAQWALATDDKVVFDNIWTHIALVQDGTSPVIYIDGVAVAQSFSTTTDKTDWLATLTGVDNGRVGCRSIQNSGEQLFLTGYIDEVCYWNRALSAGEVYLLFTNGATVNNRISTRREGEWGLVPVIAGATVTDKYPVYIDAAGKAQHADASSAGTAVVRGFCHVGGALDAETLMQTKGLVRDSDNFSFATLGGDVWLDTTAGLLTQSPPSIVSGAAQVKVGVAIESDLLLIDIKTLTP